MAAEENMTYYKTANHITEFSVNLKNYTFGKKNALSARKLVGLRFGQARHPLNLNYGLHVNSTDSNHIYFIAINTHLEY